MSYPSVFHPSVNEPSVDVLHLWSLCRHPHHIRQQKTLTRKCTALEFGQSDVAQSLSVPRRPWSAEVADGRTEAADGSPRSHGSAVPREGPRPTVRRVSTATSAYQPLIHDSVPEFASILRVHRRRAFPEPLARGASRQGRAVSYVRKAENGPSRRFAATARGRESELGMTPPRPVVTPGHIPFTDL